MEYRITYEDVYGTVKTIVYDGIGYWDAERFAKTLGKSKILSIDLVKKDKEETKEFTGYPFMSSECGEVD